MGKPKWTQYYFLANNNALYSKTCIMVAKVSDSENIAYNYIYYHATVPGFLGQ